MPMICLKTFKNKVASDYKYWKSWVNFVNRNYNYAKEKSTVNDFVGKCKESELPSYHPYWTDKTYNSKIELIKILESHISIFKVDDSKIKILYNKSTTIKDLESKLIKMKNDLCQ